jgi:hypothetical protein
VDIYSIFVSCGHILVIPHLPCSPPLFFDLRVHVTLLSLSEATTHIRKRVQFYRCITLNVMCDMRRCPINVHDAPRYDASHSDMGRYTIQAPGPEHDYINLEEKKNKNCQVRQLGMFRHKGQNKTHFHHQNHCDRRNVPVPSRSRGLSLSVASWHADCH